MKIESWYALFFCTILLSSCGGSSSSGGGVAANESLENGSSIGDESTNEGDESTDASQDLDNSDPTNSDNALSTLVSGRQARALPGLSADLSVQSYVMDPNGNVALFASDRTRTLFGGTINGVSPLSSEVNGEAITSVDKIQLGTDNSIGFTLTTGDGNSRLVALSQEGSNPDTLLQIGDTVPSFPRPYVIDSLDFTVYSSAGFAARGSTRTTSGILSNNSLPSIWLVTPTTTTAVVPVIDLGFLNLQNIGSTIFDFMEAVFDLDDVSGLVLDDSGCEYFHEVRSASFSRITPFGLSNSGSLIFNARGFGRNVNDSCPGLVVEYKDGQYSILLSVGDPIPGTTNATYATVNVAKVLNDDAYIVIGSTDVGAETNLGVSVIHSLSGSQARLVSVEGEQLQTDTVDTLIPAGFELLYTEDYFGYESIVEGEKNLFFGAYRGGQPLADLTVPGTSTLEFITRVNGTLSVSNADAVAFTSIDSVDIGPNRLMFSGTQDTGENTDDISGYWEAQSASDISEIIRVGDILNFSGEEYTFSRLSPGSSLFSTTQGDILFEGIFDGVNSSDSKQVLIHVLPD